MESFLNGLIDRDEEERWRSEEKTTDGIQDLEFDLFVIDGDHSDGAFHAYDQRREISSHHEKSSILPMVDL